MNTKPGSFQQQNIPQQSSAKPAAPAAQAVAAPTQPQAQAPKPAAASTAQQIAPQSTPAQAATPAAAKPAAKAPEAPKAKISAPASAKPEAKKLATTPVKTSSAKTSSTSRAASNSGSSWLNAFSFEDASNNPFEAAAEVQEALLAQAEKINEAMFSAAGSSFTQWMNSLTETAAENTKLLEQFFKCKSVADVSKLQADYTTKLLSKQTKSSSELSGFTSKIFSENPWLNLLDGSLFGLSDASKKSFKK